MHGLPLLPHGYLMVDLFFLLSGFVLSAGYGDRLAQGGAGGWFIGKRLVRLYPLAFLGLALGFAVALALALLGRRSLEADAPAMFALGALFLPWLVGGLISPLNGPAWSLQLELWVNALYGACARVLTDRRLAVLAGAAAIVLAAVCVATGRFEGGFATTIRAGRPDRRAIWSAGRGCSSRSRWESCCTGYGAPGSSRHFPYDGPGWLRPRC